MAVNGLTRPGGGRQRLGVPGLEDAYELGGAAGEGRATVVRLGVRRGDCRSVALKQLRSEHAEHTDRRRRFVQQAQRAALLEHPAIERVLDIVEGDRAPVIVSEWIDGTSLERIAETWRAVNRPWDIELVVAIARRLLDALRHAHQQPHAFDGECTVHGGINPRNVMIDARGNVKVVDFGMASVWQEATEPWQDLEAMRYLSADQLRHGPSPGADVYAVGAIVHELLSGKRFRGECETEQEMRAEIDRLSPPPRPCDDIPEEVEHLRRRLLESGTTPRLTMEHVLDLCAELSQGSVRPRFRALVRRTLRRTSTRSDDAPSADNIARVRSRPAALEHAAAGLKLRPVTRENAPVRRRGRDTRSVPIPVHHEKTAPRRPLLLQQTAPPQSEQARLAEQQRSGQEDYDWQATLIAQTDTAPLPTDTAAAWAVRQPDFAVDFAAAFESDDEDDPEIDADTDAEIEAELDDDPIINLDETAEVRRMPSISGMNPVVASTRTGRTQPSAIVPPQPGWRRWWPTARWVVLGAVVVGMGVPLVQHCGGDASKNTARR